MGEEPLFLVSSHCPACAAKELIQAAALARDRWRSFTKGEASGSEPGSSLFGLAVGPPSLRSGVGCGCGSGEREPRLLPGATKEQRKVQRREIGALSSLVVQDKTRKRYEEMFHRFCKFQHLRSNFSVSCWEQFDDQVAEFIEMLWDSGEVKPAASYALAATQFFRPQAKRRLPWSWTGESLDQVEAPCRAAPLNPELVLSCAGQACLWNQVRFGWLLVAGFALFLRTGELLNIKVKDVAFAGSSVVVFIPSSKGVKREPKGGIH